MRPLSALVLLVACSVALAAEPDKDGFVPLFNGKDLSGWVPSTCIRRLLRRTAIITTDSRSVHEGMQYENFISDGRCM